MQSNKQIVDHILANLPPNLFGQVELHFSNGQISYSRLIITQKHQPEPAGVTNNNAQSWRK